MLSLSQALCEKRIPEALVDLIHSYIPVLAYKNWRLTNKQAYSDVEEMMCKRIKQIQSQQPSAFRVSPQCSLFLVFISQTYQCAMCTASVFPSSHSLEIAQLCDKCSVAERDIEPCEECNEDCFLNNGDSCTECSVFYCENCSEDFMSYCRGCNFLFCSSCRENDFCADCT
jgi:hypothetical protein